MQQVLLMTMAGLYVIHKDFIVSWIILEIWAFKRSKMLYICIIKHGLFKGEMKNRLYFH
jgi:hypothetical protein